ncbi:MAG TPA: hypothetical protein VNZ86_11035 [Bacteroidia bacterium]|jgi:hypothetical protein|nr:hypothetical protein [Bacteroidia bacterium]
MNKRRIRGIVCACLLGLAYLPGIAQSSPGGKPDSIPVPVHVNVFSSSTSWPEPSVARENPVSPSHWILKCNPLIFIVGQVPVYLEHKLSKSYSLEGAVGLTFENYGKDALVDGKTLFQKASNVDQLAGFCGKVALRYYSRHTALSKVYWSPEFDFTDYRKDVTGVYMNSSGRYTGGKLRDQQDYADLRVILGFQNTENYDSDFCFDWYAGLGLRLGSESNVVPEEGNPNAILTKHADIISPTVSIGVKIGLGF